MRVGHRLGVLLRELVVGRALGVSIAVPDSGWTILLDWSGYSVVGTVANPNDERLDARCREELESLGWFGLWDDYLGPEQGGFGSYGTWRESPIDIYRLGMLTLRTVEALGMSYESLMLSSR
jgi:hypothetical protein